MSNFVTIETDIEPPYVVVSLADWNTMNEALTAESKRAKSAESQRDFFKSRLEELKIELGQCLATDHARFYHLWKIRAETAENENVMLRAQLEKIDKAHVTPGLAAIGE